MRRRWHGRTNEKVLAVTRGASGIALASAVLAARSGAALVVDAGRAG